MKTVELPVVTNSGIRTYRRCQREYKFAYVLGYRPVSNTESMRFGTLMHLLLEHFYRGASVDFLYALAGEKAFDAYEAAKARALIHGYVVRYEGQQLGETIGPEVEFLAPLRNPDTGMVSRTYQRGGKMDVLFTTAYMEHKVTGEDISVGSVYWKRLMLDTQISTYFDGAKSLGYDIDSCIYDVLRRPLLRPSNIPLTDSDGTKIVLDANGERVKTKDGKKWRQTGDTELGYVLQTRLETPEEFEARILNDIAEKPDLYFQRQTIVRLENEVYEAEADAWQTTKAMRESELSGWFPRNPDSCERYGKMCSYFDVCSGTASLDNESLFRKADAMHEELSL